jgi:UDP-GlcNAc:undecaprenyl-phosphate/decaprenyl-phosphate GlcNAc-1-phosphate transferase
MAIDKEMPPTGLLSNAGRGVSLLAGLSSVVLLLPPVRARFDDAGMRWLCMLMTSCLIAAGLTPLARELALKVGAVDLPSPRKIHRAATPLLGGVAVYLAFLVALLANVRGIAHPLILTDGTLGMLIGGTVLFLVGIRDDIREVPALTKMLVQVAAAGIVVASGKLLTPFPHGPMGDALNVSLTVLWIVGITNAFNFFDGMDGLATGLAVIIALFLATVAFQTGQPPLGWMAVALIGSGLGFLPYNFRPGGSATIFLGDAGSTFLGFTLACLAVQGDWAHGRPIVSLSIPILIFGVLIYDMVYLTVERVHTGKVKTLKQYLEYVGKDHMHHRLERALGSRAGAVLMILLLSVALGLAGVLLPTARAMDALFLLFLATIIVVVVSILERRGRGA